jgi:hypothetical protein
LILLESAAHGFIAIPGEPYNSLMSSARNALLSAATLVLAGTGFFWQREYRGLGAAIAAAPAPPAPPFVAEAAPAAITPELEATLSGSHEKASAPAGAARVAAPPVAPVEVDPLAGPSSPIANSAAAGSAPAPIESNLDLAGNPASLAVITSNNGPLVRLKGQDGADRLGVVIEPGVALGPILELAYNPEALRLESLATEPLSLFSLKGATKAVPVVNPLGVPPGVSVKLCGLGDNSFECFPGKLKQGLHYVAADDRVMLDAGNFTAEFTGGAALFKTGTGGGLLGYQPDPVDAKHASFIPVNYAGRFSSMRDSLGPLLSVPFSDLLMHGRADATLIAPPSAPQSAPTSAPKSAP